MYFGSGIFFLGTCMQASIFFGVPEGIFLFSLAIVVAFTSSLRRLVSLRSVFMRYPSAVLIPPPPLQHAVVVSFQKQIFIFRFKPTCARCGDKSAVVFPVTACCLHRPLVCVIKAFIIVSALHCGFSLVAKWGQCGYTVCIRKLFSALRFMIAAFFNFISFSFFSIYYIIGVFILPMATQLTSD